MGRRTRGGDRDQEWFDAIERGDVDTVRAMLADRFDVNTRNDYDWNGFSYAISIDLDEQRKDMIRTLLEAGINMYDYMITGVDEFVEPFSQEIEKGGDLEILQMLLDYGGDLSEQDFFGYNPLESTFNRLIGMGPGPERDHLVNEVIPWLIDHGGYITLHFLTTRAKNMYQEDIHRLLQAPRGPYRPSRHDAIIVWQEWRRVHGQEDHLPEPNLNSILHHRPALYEVIRNMYRDEGYGELPLAPAPPAPARRIIPRDPFVIPPMNGLATLTIPKHARNELSYNDINVTRPIMNFHEEHTHGRHYQNEGTINYLKKSRKNPFTRELIVNTRWYRPVFNNNAPPPPPPSNKKKEDEEEGKEGGKRTRKATRTRKAIKRTRKAKTQKGRSKRRVRKAKTRKGVSRRS